MSSGPKFVGKFALVCLSAFVFAGCGTHEPSTEDIQKALIAAEPNADKSALDVVKNLVKVSCTANGDKSYRCDVANKDGKGAVATFRMVKTDSGWQAGRP